MPSIVAVSVTVMVAGLALVLNRSSFGPGSAVVCSRNSVTAVAFVERDLVCTVRSAQRCVPPALRQFRVRVGDGWRLWRRFA
jgi:hypothetical protein